MVDLSNMTIEELKTLNTNVVAQIRYLQGFRQYEAGRELSIGCTVKFSGRGGMPLEGKVEKINTKSVKVRTSQGLWNVSPTLLTKV